MNGSTPKRRENGTKPKVLVTGGSGFIGQHLVAALSAQKQSVRVLDVQQPPSAVWPTEFIRGSILDPDAVRRAMDGVDIVYHLAGIPHFWTADRADFERVNHRGTELVLAAAAERNVSRFVHCSTEAILFPPPGDDAEKCLSLEDMPGPYTRSKFLAEASALQAARNGMPVVIVNPTVPIGPGDHNRTAPTAMLSLFIEKPPMFIMDCILNLVDVRDVATGMILAASRGQIGERYILGGENVTVRELVRRMDLVCGRKTTSFAIPAFAALATGFAAEWFANAVSQKRPLTTAEAVRVALRSIPLSIDKTCDDLGYRPKPIDPALAETIQWLLRPNTAGPVRQSIGSVSVSR
ncbi:NAD-dependent epimerase/dehydratase family protein [Rhodoligotrophos ferricapiens]|uniref:NAD-dependent epimerase/dehydratase family protein n=1 Tax=Rhodoligotrophos ferricapiens TaxID=3069264 RepID=UPI00315D749A